MIGQVFQLMKSSKHQFRYAIRRLQKAQNNLQRDKFMTKILKGGSSIFDEIKKFRGHSKKCSSTIDGEVGSTNIANLFANIYKDLYNKDGQSVKIENLSATIEERISSEDLFELGRINESVIRQGLKWLMDGKTDANFNFQSNCLIEGPEMLIKHICNMFRMFVSHGQVPDIILVCTILPLVKDNLGDLTSSDNYRAIATGSQLLKLLDIVILILEGDKLRCDGLQFGFQQKSSTTMCSWLASAIIDKYNQLGSSVYCCTMDMRKAFDMVEWSGLFQELSDKKINPLYLRILLDIYINQSYIVEWNGTASHSFRVSNGVRQGSVSSPVLFSIYIDRLFSKLRNTGFGCKFYNVFYGCLGYADNILLLSASGTGLQAMVDICSKFMSIKGLRFSTNKILAKSKTKCILFSKRKMPNVAPIKLNGDELPWVSDIKHLGNILEKDNSMRKDVAVKRGKAIGKINSLFQEFHFAKPSTLIKILNIYAVSFPGSGLWDLFSRDCDRIYRTWNVTIRQALNVPRDTHRYLIEPLSQSLHPKVMLASRYCQFVNSLLQSPKLQVRVMGRMCISDHRTVMCNNLLKISKECGFTDWCEGRLTARSVKIKMRYSQTPKEQEWRECILKELLSEESEVPGFSQQELDDMAKFICSS